MALPAILAGILGPAIGSVLDRLIPDKNAREAAKEEITKSIANLDEEMIKGQLDINKIEASHTSIFVSGARPFILWGSGLGIFYSVIVWPHLQWLSAYMGWPAPPAIDTEGLMFLCANILGLGTMRTLEKKAGVASK